MPDQTLQRPRLYLAGPEVFLPDAIEIGRVKSKMADAAGFEGLYPLDNALDLTGLGKSEQAALISSANEKLMRQAHAAVANLTPFRGASMDAGTAYEVGFMRALGKPVFGYSMARANYRERAIAYRKRGLEPEDFDRPDVDIEDFDLAENLMIDCAVQAAQGHVLIPQAHTPLTHAPSDSDGLAGFQLCLQHARRHFFG
jgi:nucleoside 2-deoxyribosyltransferase